MITLSDHAPSPRISPRSRSVCQSDASNVGYESDHFSSLSGSISDISVSPGDDDEAYLRSTDPSASTGDEILTPTSCAFGTGSRTPLSEGSELKAFKFRTEIHNTSSTDTGSSSCTPTPRSNLIRLSSKIGDHRMSHALERRYQERLESVEDEQQDLCQFGESEFQRCDPEDDSDDDCLYLSLPWVIQVDDDDPTTKEATKSSSSSKRRKFSKKVLFLLSLSVAIPSTITLVILLVL